MRRSLVILLAALGIACQADTPTMPGLPTGVTTGFFANGSVQLSYRLQLPAQSGPVPAVVFGHGSGPVTKETCNAAGLADGFRARGYATLCFDKRGTGQSTGQFINPVPLNSFLIFEELASDIASGVAFLRNRPEIDPNRIGIAGVSQAGWIVPIAAAKTEPAFMLLIVAPTVSLGLEHFYSNIVEGNPNIPLEDGYNALPSFTGYHGFDPKPVLETLNVPGLWLLGGEDRSIPTPATVAILNELIASGRPYTHVVYPGLGHVFPPNSWADIDKWLAKIMK